MRWMGGVMVATVVLLAATTTTTRAEVLCVRAKKDGTLSGAIKVRTECKRREVQVDAPMLGLCCDPFTTTTTSTSTTATSDTGFTTTMPPASTTSTTAPNGTTSTSVAGTTTTTVTFVVTTTSTSTVTSTVVTTSSTSTSSTSTSTVTTTTLTCPTITTTTLILPNCGGNPPFCFGFCADGRECVSSGGLECTCGPILACHTASNGTCGGSCPGGMVCGQTVTNGPDGCPQSLGCGCVDP